MTVENVILYFWNAACSVCKPLYEKLKLLMETVFPQLSIEKIDASTIPELRVKYQVFLSPLIVLIMDGKEFFRNSSNVSLHDLKEKINRLYGLKYN